MTINTDASRLATNEVTADRTIPCTATRVVRSRAQSAISTKTNAWTPWGAPDTRSKRYPVAKETTAAAEMVHLEDNPTWSTTRSPRLGATMCTGASSSTVDCKINSR